VLVVAGGGGGGSNQGSGTATGAGGGGAGGLIYSENYSVSSGQVISVNVGSGGTAPTTSGPGNNGENSSFGSLIAIGGGGGGNRWEAVKDGGSGGGVGYFSTVGGLGTPGQGYNGGSSNSSLYGGAGGGGASAEGGFVSTHDGTDGGDGLYYGDIFGDIYGDNGWFAAGGGGGTRDGAYSIGLGGIGGGGDGGNDANGTAAVANTGSGGGGSGDSGHIGGDGGSGVILIRYRALGKAQITDINSGLVGHWSMDEEDYNSTNSRISDKTPFENHGTNYGATFTEDRFGKEGGAMEFVDSDVDRIIVPNINFSEDDNWSYSAWYVLDQSGHNCFNTWSGPRFLNGRLYFYHNQGGAENMTSAFDGYAEYGTWEYLSIVKEGLIIKGYINGEYVGSVSFENRIYVVEQISRTSSEYGWTGKLDDIKVYNRALSESEIKSLYDSYNPKTTTGSLQKGLVLDMPLKSRYTKSEVAGSEIMTDRTPYSNDGQNYGAVISSEGASFDGVDNYIDCENSIIPSGSFSLSAWVLRTGSGYSMIIDQYKAGQVGRFVFRISDNNKLMLGFFPSTYEADTVLDIDTWYHVVAVRDETNEVKVYLNSLLDITPFTDDQSITQLADTGIGGPYMYHSGSISNVLIYNRALLEDEIKTLYDRGRSDAGIIFQPEN
jgi:hypothetical protein